MEQKALLMDCDAMRRSLIRITHEILEKNKGAANICLVGIKRRGKPLADIIADNIKRFDGAEVPCGELDINYYRDDLSLAHDAPVFKKASLDFECTGRDIVLVDDVIYTGRTTRAAIEAVFSLGRPKSIQLAVLIDRGHRELPIRPDYVGKNIPTAKNEHISVMIPPYDETSAVMLYGD